MIHIPIIQPIATESNPSAWNLDNLTYVGAASTTPSDTGGNAGIVSENGLYAYITSSGPDAVYMASMTTPWDITTLGVWTKSVISSMDGPISLFVKPDGTKLYVVGYPEDDGLQEFSLSTPWNIISGRTRLNTDLSILTTMLAPRGLGFSNDGYNYYIASKTEGKIYQRRLTTAWDTSSTIISTKSLFVDKANITINGFSFNSIGTRIFTTDYTNKTLISYSLSTPWDVSTGTLYQTKYLGDNCGSPQGTFINSTGQYFYTNDSSAGGIIRQWKFYD